MSLFKINITDTAYTKKIVECIEEEWLMGLEINSFSKLNKF